MAYAKTILDAGASIITVHGRQRDQKGHKTGLADWSMIRYLREQLPSETVIFANGNILQYGDIQECLDATQADGVMSAEGNLYDPSIFATAPPAGEEGREYWRGKNGKGGYRADAVLRRYLDIIHKHVFNREPPERLPLFLPSDESAILESTEILKRGHTDEESGRPTKKQKREEKKVEKKNTKPEKVTNANLVAMQAHCFHILRPLVSKHHDVRDALARSRAGDIDAYENVLTLTEKAVKEGLLAYEADPAAFDAPDEEAEKPDQAEARPPMAESSDEAVRRCRRPYWVCQPYVRPLPKEALEKGSLQLSKKELKQLAKQEEEAKKAGVEPEGTTEEVQVNGSKTEEVPAQGMVSG